MWAGVYGNQNLPDEPPCPKCGKPIAVHYAEREYETDNPDYHNWDGTESTRDADPLASCSVIEAWINCPRCGRLTCRSGDRMWSDEVFGTDPITNAHIVQAIDADETEKSPGDRAGAEELFDEQSIK